MSNSVKGTDLFQVIGSAVTIRHTPAAGTEGFSDFGSVVLRAGGAAPALTP